MDPDGNRLQNSCSPRHWGHSTMHRVPPVSGTTTTICCVVHTVTAQRRDRHGSKVLIKIHHWRTLITFHTSFLSLVPQIE